MRLTPCPHCARHVRAAPRCHFCQNPCPRPSASPGCLARHLADRRRPVAGRLRRLRARQGAHPGRRPALRDVGRSSGSAPNARSRRRLAVEARTELALADRGRAGLVAAQGHRDQHDRPAAPAALTPFLNINNQQAIELGQALNECMQAGPLAAAGPGAERAVRAAGRRRVADPRGPRDHAPDAVPGSRASSGRDQRKITPGPGAERWGGGEASGAPGHGRRWRGEGCRCFRKVTSHRVRDGEMRRA